MIKAKLNRKVNTTHENIGKKKSIFSVDFCTMSWNTFWRSINLVTVFPQIVFFLKYVVPPSKVEVQYVYSVQHKWISFFQSSLILHEFWPFNGNSMDVGWRFYGVNDNATTRNCFYDLLIFRWWPTFSQAINQIWYFDSSCKVN